MSKNTKTTNAKTTKTNEAKTETKKTVSKRTPRDVFGNRLATRSHVINASIVALKGKAFTVAELSKLVNADDNKLAREYCKLAGKDDVGAIRNHLLFLVEREYLTFNEDDATYKVIAKKSSK